MQSNGERSDLLDETRLFLEELCCDLCRFEHVSAGLTGLDVNILREFHMGRPGAFADLRVEPKGQPPYFLEVKYRYPSAQIVRHLARKYGSDCLVPLVGMRLIVVVDRSGRDDWEAVTQEIRSVVHPDLTLEFWNEETVSKLVQDRFNVTIEMQTEMSFLKVRDVINQAKAAYAFGDQLATDPLHPLQASLLWQFGSWYLRERRQSETLDARAVLPPGLFSRVVVLLADLCSFSSYVRDTPDERISRQALTSFYSRARYQIINNGGMLYQFVGDEVVALYGLPGARASYVQDALDTARALVDIGNSVSHHWQRHIDRFQTSGGVHIGMAIGDLQVVSLQPFGRTHMGVVGDVINMAARLMSAAGPSEIVVSNTLFCELNETRQAEFKEIEPVDAKNLGRIKAWQTAPAKVAGQPTAG
jgi:class 3 adenylate cyclase